MIQVIINSLFEFGAHLILDHFSRATLLALVAAAVFLTISLFFYFMARLIYLQMLCYGLVLAVGGFHYMLATSPAVNYAQAAML